MSTKALLDVGLEVGESVLDIWGRHLYTGLPSLIEGPMDWISSFIEDFSVWLRRSR